MLERWRKPLGVVHVEASNESAVTSDGRVMRLPSFIFDADSLDRLRLGYACVKCMEPFETPWPERCNTCGAPIASKQREYFAQEYAGMIKLGSSHSLEDERALLREYEEEKE